MATNDDARGEIVDNGFRFVLFVFEICWTYEIYSQTEVVVQKERPPPWSL